MAAAIMAAKAQPAADVEAEVQANLPHLRLYHPSYEAKGLPATWRCILHNREFRSNASYLRRPGIVGCPDCLEELQRRKRKKQLADPDMQRNFDLIRSRLSEEFALVYRLRCEGAKLKEIGAEFGIDEQFGELPTCTNQSLACSGCARIAGIDMSNLDGFRAFYELADRLIDGASKEDVAEAARILAMNVAHYQLKYGALPLENFADMLRAETIDAETAELLSAGMQNLVGALGEILGLAEGGEEDAVH